MESKTETRFIDIVGKSKPAQTELLMLGSAPKTLGTVCQQQDRNSSYSVTVADFVEQKVCI